MPKLPPGIHHLSFNIVCFHNTINSSSATRPKSPKSLTTISRRQLLRPALRLCRVVAVLNTHTRHPINGKLFPSLADYSRQWPPTHVRLTIRTLSLFIAHNHLGDKIVSTIDSALGAAAIAAVSRFCWK